MAAQLGLLGGETVISDLAPANDTSSGERKGLEGKRKQSVRARKLTKYEERVAQARWMREANGDETYERPQSRADCLPGGCNGVRPCPFVSCKHHLYIDVDEDSGSLVVNFPDVAPEDLHLLADTCALDVADRVARGEALSLDEVGKRINVTGERLIQVNDELFRMLKNHRPVKEMRE